MITWDSRRDIIIPGDETQTLLFAANHWINTAKLAINKYGFFSVALSGGSTPQAIYQILSQEHQKSIDWNKVLVFFGDERNVPLDSPESNYFQAKQSGLFNLPIPQSQIFPIDCSKDLVEVAEDYGTLIKSKLGKDLFHLVMLGVGEDGHTASLFPNTAALEEKEKLVVANFIPNQNKFRITITYPCINSAQTAVIYALGERKKEVVSLVLNSPLQSQYPSSAIGSEKLKALWIIDQKAASLIINKKISN
jgi:6-phosphogluconolactonase